VLCQAARLLGAAEALRMVNVRPRPPVYQPTIEVTLAAVRVGLGVADFDLAWAAGQALTPEEAIAEAIGMLPASGP
jgi:hypothetical protein